MGRRSQHSLDIRIWDVAHGSAAFIQAGRKNIILDCGANDKFSPARWISGSKYGINTIHYMIISHPHHDHIEDLDMVDRYELKPKIINRPKKASDLVKEKLAEARQEGDEEYIEDAEYYLMLDEYSGTPDPKPSDPSWAYNGEALDRLRADGGTRPGPTFHNYSARDPSIGSSRYERLNNLSKVTVIDCFDFNFVSTGDLLKQGINELVDNNSKAMEMVEDADVLVAPHHGRESSFVPEFVEHISPRLVVISEESSTPDEDYTVPEKYRVRASGMPVKNENTGNVRDRRVVTTRSDGRIRIQASNADTWEVSVSGTAYAQSVALTKRYRRIGQYSS